MARSPEVEKIRQKLNTVGWPKLIQSVSIDKIHGFSGDQSLELKFPVCAIVGENGTGKSTFLKALACAYKGNGLFPADLFPSTTWDRMQGVTIRYRIKLGPNVEARSITKPTERWRGLSNRPENEAYYFDLNRIQPIESVIGYSKLAKRAIAEASSRPLLPESTNSISNIMGRAYLGCRYAKTVADTKKEVGILRMNFGEVSQFHQGAGESIVTNLVSAIEGIQNSSLVIIDEIESSLHPKSQRRLIRQLLGLARIKSLQIVISTHSPYVLSELPPEARILLARLDTGIQIIYSPAVELCLSQIDEEMHYELYVAVEDIQSRCLILAILIKHHPDLAGRINVLPVGSADIVKVLSNLGASGKLPFKMMGIVDADQVGMEPAIKMPGTMAPEKQVICDVANSQTDKIAILLGVDEVFVKKQLTEVQTILDYHEWLTWLAPRFSMSRDTLWSYLTTVWVRGCLRESEAKPIIEAVADALSSPTQGGNGV